MVDLEQFREAVEQWKMLAQVGEVVEEMPVVFRKKPEEYTARIAEADRLLSIIDSAGKVGTRPADLERRARELLAAEYERGRLYDTAERIRRHDPLPAGWQDDCIAIRAIIAALRQQPAACDTCDGRGWIDDGHEQDDGRMVAAPEACPRCKGSGHKAAQQPAAVVGLVEKWRSELPAHDGAYAFTKYEQGRIDEKRRSIEQLTAALSSVQGVESP